VACSPHLRMQVDPFRVQVAGLPLTAGRCTSCPNHACRQEPRQAPNPNVSLTVTQLWQNEFGFVF
jgi:hypothetical protein